MAVRIQKAAVFGMNKKLQSFADLIFAKQSPAMRQAHWAQFDNLMRQAILAKSGKWKYSSNSTNDRELTDFGKECAG
jgi:hypothetical protein